MVKCGNFFIKFDCNNNLVKMKPLVGTHDCKVDAKGRVMLPSSLKKQMSSVLQNGFVLKRAVFQNCLELYPISEWNELIEKINSLNRFKKKNNDFIRRFTAGVRLIELDSSGRFLIPKDLIDFSNITKDIVISSSVNIIEIWDKTSYEKVLKDSAIDFAELAEEVMGDEE